VSTYVSIEEAIGPEMKLAPADYFVHLLSLDVHSIQAAEGYKAGILTARHPYSFERWIRAVFVSDREVQSIRFWADNLALPPGWDVRFGVSDTYHRPVNVASSIATLPVPTSSPSGANVSAALLEPGTNRAPWVVIQAHVTDFGLVEQGPLLGQTGTEVIVPTMIHYHFGWNES